MATQDEDLQQSAGNGLRDSINAITQHVAKMSIKKIREEFADPFASKVEQQIDEMNEKLESVKENFRESVLEAVRSSRRELVDERIKQFNVDDLIGKLTEIPSSIAAQQANVKNAEASLETKKSLYESELVNLVTVAAQNGLQGQNKEDRESIISLIEDRIKNEGQYGTSVDIIFQSSGRDKVLMECHGLEISVARKHWKDMESRSRELDDARIELHRLENQFAALRKVASLITTISS